MVSPLQVEAVAPYCKIGLLKVLGVDLGVTLEPFGIVIRRGHEMSPATQAMLAALQAAARTQAKRARRKWRPDPVTLTATKARFPRIR